MTETQAQQVAELRHAGWEFTFVASSVLANHPEHGGVVVRSRDEGRRLVALLEGVYALVGNPWGGSTPQPAAAAGAVRTRGTNPGFPGHGKPVES